MEQFNALTLLTLILSAAGLEISKVIPDSLSKGLTKSNSSELLSKINQGIEQDISDVKQPVLKSVVKGVFAPCDEVKKLFGVAYAQLEGDHEPDVNSLSLKYISRDVNVSYNINSAARVIAQEARHHSADEKLFIYIHGFTDNPGQSSFGNVSEALYAKGINNVLALDAGFLIKQLYLRSTTYVRFVGEKLGGVLAALMKNGISASSIHIIGHSLGSHMASFTGKAFKEATGQRVGRITGLDPAGPCFTQAEPELRIQASDADFVDIIHTNGGVLGMEEAVGHVDYYPNGGSEQPNCKLSSGCSHSRAWLMFSESVLDEKLFPAVPCSSWEDFKAGKCGEEIRCKHNRAWLMFSESVLDEKLFAAVSCSSWEDFKAGKCGEKISYMGFGSKPTAHGKYYLQTSGEPPFGLGTKGTNYEETSFTKYITKALF